MYELDSGEVQFAVHIEVCIHTHTLYVAVQSTLHESDPHSHYVSLNLRANLLC